MADRGPARLFGDRCAPPNEHPDRYLVHILETNDDPDGLMFQQIRDRMIELEAERVLKLEQLQQLRQNHRQVDPYVIDLLDALPLAHHGLKLLPETFTGF